MNVAVEKKSQDYFVGQCLLFGFSTSACESGFKFEENVSQRDSSPTCPVTVSDGLPLLQIQLELHSGRNPRAAKMKFLVRDAAAGP